MHLISAMACRVFEFLDKYGVQHCGSRMLLYRMCVIRAASDWSMASVKMQRLAPLLSSLHRSKAFACLLLWSNRLSQAPEAGAGPKEDSGAIDDQVVKASSRVGNDEGAAAAAPGGNEKSTNSRGQVEGGGDTEMQESESSSSQVVCLLNNGFRRSLSLALALLPSLPAVLPPFLARMATR